jgi:hypothetical protein
MTPNKLEKIKSKVLKRVSFLKIYNIKSVSENDMESKIDGWSSIKTTLKCIGTGLLHASAAYS